MCFYHFRSAFLYWQVWPPISTYSDRNAIYRQIVLRNTSLRFVWDTLQVNFFKVWHFSWSVDSPQSWYHHALKEDVGSQSCIALLELTEAVGLKMFEHVYLMMEGTFPSTTKPASSLFGSLRPGVQCKAAPTAARNTLADLCKSLSQKGRQ